MTLTGTAVEPPPWERKDTRFRTSDRASGFHLGADECPWIPSDIGCANKFMLFDLRRNELVTLFRIDPGHEIPTHYHACPVVGHVLQGAFKYRESGWVANAGTTVYEPAGEAHTLMNVGEVPMIACFHVTGPVLAMDKAGNQSGWMDAFAMREFTLRWCVDHGHDTAFIDRITR